MNVGIIAAKSISKRLPGKNVRTVGGVPLFWYSVQPLVDAKTVDKVYVATDSMLIKEYCNISMKSIMKIMVMMVFDDHAYHDAANVF